MSVSLYAKLAGCLFTGALIMTAAVSQDRSCVLGAPTAQSYTWNFRQEAQQLIGDVRAEAWRVSFHADKLENFTPDIDWQEHADELSAIRSEVNDMGSKLCRLEEIRRAASPWEQRAIDDAAPVITEMANEAQAAITFLDNNRNHLFNPGYHAYSEEMYQQSSKLTHQMDEFSDFGKVHQEDIRLEKSLGLIKRS